MAAPTYLILLQTRDGEYIHLWGPLGGVEPHSTTGAMQIPLTFGGVEPVSTTLGEVIESLAGGEVAEPVTAATVPEYTSAGVTTDYETSGRLIWV